MELLQALKWLNDFCIENNIKYSLHGGTLLGAVREKGFIPWDDDADVTFTRTEFNRFESVLLDKEINNEVIYINNRRYPKIFFKRENKPAVWIDVFIYDSISNNRVIQRIKKTILYYYLILLRSPNTFNIIEKTANYNSLLLFLMRMINKYGQHIPYEKRIEGGKRATQRFGGTGELIHRANDQKSGINEIQPSYVMSKYKMVPFEDTELMISVFYDEILTKSYGKDYMTPKRKKNQEMSDTVVLSERKMAEKLFTEKEGNRK